ncbi:hypothetical protein LTR66_005103 [Elasticomyces elasticus]|nr:hypothetical protein LTR66_005103 [Elasticomyces elasticus]
MSNHRQYRAKNFNQNGSFEFDRVLKAGEVCKRTRMKSWKPVYIVLRPNLLSIYKDKSESKLRHQVTLSDLTAVARQRDPKRKAKYVFALFSPSKNFHLEARSDKEAQEWVELIRREARIDEDEEEMVLASPGGARSTYNGFERHANLGSKNEDGSRRSIQGMMDQHAGYSSSDMEMLPRTPRAKGNTAASHSASARRPSHTMDYSGAEGASFSDFSDSAGPAAARMSALSLSHPEHAPKHAAGPAAQSTAQGNNVYGAGRPSMNRNPSQMSILGMAGQSALQDDERVVSHGWIYLLKSKRGVRQWKKVWMVLRPKALGLYKNEEEYSPLLIIPFHTIIDAVEIDEVSKSKRFCLQIISEDRNYRCCAADEDALERWLGGFKSLLVRRKEMEKEKEKEKGGEAGR